MTTLHTFDPGNSTGWGHFEKGQLLDAGVLPFSSMSAYITATVCAGDSVLIEVPRHYPHNEKGDTNDLIDLAVQVGQLKAWCELRGATVTLVWPRTWKGSVPKNIHNERVLRALSDVERKLLPKSPRARKYDHNCVDAVGLGLWKLERLQ